MTERNDQPPDELPDDPELLIHEVDEVIFADPALLEDLGSLVLPLQRESRENAA